MNKTKYNPEEILQILNDFYNCQAVFDPEVETGEALIFGTTISEWRSICDLIEPKKLARVYYESFNLATPIADLEDLFLQKSSKLRDFCRYISEHATKQTIKPIIIMGQSCMTAAIYKTLISNLKERGVKTQNISPSSKFIPLFNKYGAILMEEVNKLAPGTLTKFEYRENWIVKIGIAFNLIFFLSIVVVPIVWHFHWSLMFILALGITISVIGNKFKPAKETIGGYETIRDLIFGMQAVINKTT